jgi:hypothetical protein
MTAEPNIFDSGWPMDYRWDTLQNGKLLNILFQGGTFGNFLKYFVEKYSNLTPSLEDLDPFTSTGTAHEHDDFNWSGLVQRYHSSFINDNEKNENLPICQPLPTNKKHFLYFKQAQLFRVGDMGYSPDLLWKEPLGEMKEAYSKYARQILDFYEIKERDSLFFSHIPKFIVRDYYKLEFLEDLKTTYNFRWFQNFKNHPWLKKQKVFHLDLESFFDWKVFLENMYRLNDFFNLQLDFSLSKEIEKDWLKSYDRDVIRKNCNLAEAVLEKNKECDLKDLDVSIEAYIYAELEKKYDFIQMPLTNRFFKDTTEIEQYVSFYPRHYKAMNPNLKTFRNLPNPFYLENPYKQKG